MNYDYKLGLGLAFLVQNESYARLFASSIQSNEKLGGEVHYMNCGRNEGRSWLLSTNTNAVNSPLIIHKSLLSKWKSLIYILKYTVLIFVVALIKLIIDLIKRPKIFFNPIVFLFVSFLTYYIVFSIAMGYISVSMGGLDGRMYFGLNLMMPIISLLYLLGLSTVLKNGSNA
jgi:hypothetical protein